MVSVPPSEPRLAAGTTIANYVVEDFLGQGMEGCVYLARDALLGRQVALKTLREGSPGATRGVEEARILARLEHAHIVRVYHARRHHGVWYVIYEYLAGGSLEALIQRLGALPLKRALETLAQAASGLAHAHAAGIVHRDLKPQNMLLSLAGDLRLADFGLALDLKGRAPASGQPVGTPAYLAPELWSGNTATTASDVFSLGVSLYFVLTGRLPFVARDTEQLYRAQLELEPKLPMELPASVRELVLAMLAKEPQARPPCPSVTETLRALAEHPYRAVTPERKLRRLSAANPFAPGGVDHAARKALRSGPDAVYLSELLSALRGRGRAVALVAETAAQALLLTEVALELAPEPHRLFVRLTLPNAPGRLMDAMARKFECATPGSLRDACALLLEPARQIEAVPLLEVTVRRALSEEQQRELRVLLDVASESHVSCILVGASADVPAFEGVRRIEAFAARELRREHEERLEAWILVATGGRFAFSRDGLRLAAAICIEEGRHWLRLAQDSVLVAAAAGLPVVTSFAVLGACAEVASFQTVDDVPALWRRRPALWPPPDVAARLSALHHTTEPRASRERPASVAPKGALARGV
jgi:hypothetical protein